ncbi:hypothetical protein [Mesorhizobium abyssinicae]|uniref:hypothetical protein n=1 Tax=Mesorhizobium abyssinicae TaxID=1209958 RepID=UPI003CE8136A
MVALAEIKHCPALAGPPVEARQGIQRGLDLPENLALDLRLRHVVALRDWDGLAAAP